MGDDNVLLFFCKTFFNIFPLHIPSKEKPSFPSLSPFFAVPTQCWVLANNASQYLSPTFIFDLPPFRRRRSSSCLEVFSLVFY
ncbi:hypothetical protein E1A91_D06G059100v1 [Gossypium mustelinum]|uniref:Uncharacterized protein n=1 Tax=Gossypium mustelinum TaxID=34275 RepID=A0A5D2UES7_GOSMU|nr:hypothetical protein E1A91_D06G059100v1 [Gossypium mustelinum]